MIFDAFQSSHWSQAFIVGQMPIKGKKKKKGKGKKKKKLGHHIFRRIAFILSLKELSVKINDSVSLVIKMIVVGSLKVTVY